MKKLRICAAVLAAILMAGAMPTGVLSQNVQTVINNQYS